MSERVPNVSEKTKLITDAVTLFVGSTVYEGWEDVQITRELNTAAAEFQLQLVDKWRVDQEPYRIQPGAAIKIGVGKQIILNGYVDALNVSIQSNTRSVTISGRSKPGDLVDCSITSENEYSGLNIQEIATKLFKPFGIEPVFFTEPGLPFEKITVQQGESVFSLIDKLARQRNLLVYPSFNGNLIFAPVAERRLAVELRQGVNVLSGNARFDNSNRFSKYIVKGQTIGYLEEPEESIASLGEAVDKGVSRFRPLVILAEQAQDSGSTENRAAYEAEIRAAKALEIDVEVQGWFQAPNRFWGLNEVAFCDIGFLGVRRKMVTSKIVYNKNSGGTTAVLTLIRGDSFEFKKEKEKEDPIGWVKFAENKA